MKLKKRDFIGQARQVGQAGQELESLPR